MATTLWLTYAWVDNEEGDFSFLVQQLRSVGVESRYDKVELIPGQRLWDQIADRITKGNFDAWAYLITPNSVNNRRCREELGYALLRALDDRGEGFPLIGIVHGISFEKVPPSLRIRLCINLESPTWKEEILAGVEGRPPEVTDKVVSEYVMYQYPSYQGNPDLKAIEVRPRFGQIMYWGFGVSAGLKEPEAWGVGPANGGQISGAKFDVVTADGQIGGKPVKFYGCGSTISPNISAYIVYKEILPSQVWFGKSIGPRTPPSQLTELNFPK